MGLVALSDFRKRRAEAVEIKERDAQEIAGGNGNGNGNMGGSGGGGRSGASTPVDG